MRQLLNTHSFIWFVMGNPRISTKVRERIENNENLLSVASVWEMAIKHSTGKLNFGLPFMVFVEQQLSVNNIELLNINLDHIAVVATLPFHHRDPFDRLIIAQAIVGQLPILSADSVFDAYAIERFW